MSRRITTELKAQALGLRREHRMSLEEIRQATGLSKGSLSALLRDEPLSDPELRERRSASAANSNKQRRYAPEASKFQQLVAGERLGTERKGHIAEAAVLFRLALLGYEVWRSGFECHPIDWLVGKPGAKRRVGIQVRWATRDDTGRPYCNLKKQSGARRMNTEDCDFVAAYDLETDTVFVMPIEDVYQLASKSCDERYAEAWDLLGLD